MSLFKFFLLLHILGVVGWMGTAVVMFLLNRKVMHEGKTDKMFELAETLEWLTPRTFIPASLITLASGLLMVYTSERILITDLWIILAFGGVIVSMALGGGILGKLNKQILLLKNDKNKAKGCTELHSRLMFFHQLDLIIIFLVLIDMIVKPKI